ncbi:MAG: TonB-dependent receptor, partial [Rikenellaceae bacterium]|nr:TonB-dependent receptor [Rikenellaceae bacterium]MBR3801095.1 TonB-dependent receptor [Rikenellaceae bacterium]
MKRLIAIVLLLFVSATASAQLYIVNGEEYSAEQMRRIDPERVESSEQVAINDSIMALYGERAADGVIIVTLKHDTEPQFSVDSLSFREWVEREVAWGNDEPAARVVYRYVVGTDGRAQLTELIESTDNRLRQRVVRAVKRAPLWTP